jgi:hypothetical protein
MISRCTFCGSQAAGAYAVTACKGDPESADSWRREVLPVCPSCGGLLDVAGDAGRVLKATGERWFGGHGVGRFHSTAYVREW